MKSPASKSASALAKKGWAKRKGKATPAQQEAAKANGKKGGRPPSKTIVILSKITKAEAEDCDGQQWWISSHVGDVIASKGFLSAQEARNYARVNNMGIKRDKNCDQ